MFKFKNFMIYFRKEIKYLKILGVPTVKIFATVKKKYIYKIKASVRVLAYRPIDSKIVTI